MRSLLELKAEFAREGILISFNGPFTHGIIEELGNAARRYLEGEQLERGVVTDVFAVYIEQTQNVRNYLHRHELTTEPYNSAVVVIGTKEGRYTVRSGNSIRRDDVAALTSRLEMINELDKAGLKRLYKEQLRREVPPDAQGAGLGLIDMARRADGPLRFQFERLDEQHDFFNLLVTVAGA